MKSPHLIVLLSGKQGSGKTTIATRLRDLALEAGFGVHRVRFARTLYEIHDAVLPILKKAGLLAPEQDKDGPLLQLLGTDYGRRYHGPDCWVKITRREVNALTSPTTFPQFVTIEDARFENEFSFFPDAYRIRLDCSREKRRARTHAWRENENHPSETSLDHYATLGVFDDTWNTSDNFEGLCLLIMERALRFQASGRSLATIKHLRALRNEET